jgi:DNA helicase-2/ATP-dependent DNA helicase PcrA
MHPKHPENLDTASLAAALNAPQFEAVTHTPGPQLILAGAGSGKTRVLTHKIAWLIHERGFRPWEILAVTFTNKAAQEMRARIMALLGFSANLKWVGTFHSICARLLRFHATRLGYTSNFTIFDTDDQKRFVKKLLKDEGLEEDMRFTDGVVRNAISRFKNQSIAPPEAKLLAEDRFDERIAHLYHRYQEDLQKNNGMDFDDLIFMAIRLLESFPEVRQVFVSSFRYVLIDEYQDTNKAQYRFIRLLIGHHHNLIVVGDDDQSIYGWRGADVGNILSFNKDFPEAKVTRLEQNYRSTGNILGVANSVIRNNRNRMEKKMWTENEAGEKPLLLELDDEILEANWVARKIKEGGKFKPGDTAVFYRTNSQSRVIEDELRRQRIPYLIVGGIRFYERKEVKDLLAYLRVISNPRDEVSLSRIINVPKRGIGDKSVQQVQDYARDNNLNLYEALRRASAAGINTGTAKRMAEFITLLDNVRVLARTEPLPTLIAEIITRSNYKGFLEEEASDESLDRLANIEELVSAAQDFLRRRDAGELGTRMEEGEMEMGAASSAPGPVAAASPVSELVSLFELDAPTPQENQVADRAQDLDLFLQEISLVADADGLKANQEAVVLMTVHSAKGLEFPRVFVTGLEEGLFPMVREEDVDDIEEERRLFYVAVTRARQELNLTWARRRRRYGMYQEAPGSRFFGEIDRKFLQVARPSISPQARVFYRDNNEYGSDPIPTYEDFSQEEGENYRKGQRVRHDKFGEGTVVGTDGSGESARVEVVFADRVRRKLMVKFAKLQPLDG